MSFYRAAASRLLPLYLSASREITIFFPLQSVSGRPKQQARFLVTCFCRQAQFVSTCCALSTDVK
eukprot:6114931-Amphidinium_carterae.1